MENEDLRQRIIESADEYHFVGEDQWSKAIELEPTDEESVFEFLRLVRAALLYYARAYLVLDMVETDDSQGLENLLELVGEQEEEFADFFEKNEVEQTLDEDGNADFSRVFSIGESVRALLLQHSNQLAATLHQRFPA